MRVSIIIPTLNEVQTIGEILKQVDEVDLGPGKEIVIVDGNSKDGTQDIIKKFSGGRAYVKCIFEEKPEGKGRAVRRGIERATGDIIVIQDGDLEVSPFELPALIRPILDGESDVVYGSRFLHGRGKTPGGSYIGNRIVTFFCNILFCTWLTDMATCHKVVSRRVMEDIELKSKSFDFDAEITAKLLKRKNKIKELPIEYVPRGVDEGKKLHWSVGFKVIIALIKYRFIP